MGRKKQVKQVTKIIFALICVNMLLFWTFNGTLYSSVSMEDIIPDIRGSPDDSPGLLPHIIYANAPPVSVSPPPHINVVRQIPHLHVASSLSVSPPSHIHHALETPHINHVTEFQYKFDRLHFINDDAAPNITHLRQLYKGKLRQLNTLYERHITQFRYDRPTIPTHSNDSLLFTNTNTKTPSNTPSSQVRKLLTHFTPAQDWNCTVNECTVIYDQNRIHEADVVFLSDRSPNGNIQKYLSGPRRASQIWAYYTQESGRHASDPFRGRAINWTVTSSHWSTIVHPCGRLYPIDPTILSIPPSKNYAEGKPGKVVWFVSNCGAPNRRLQYARKLAEYITVDIFGGCGQRQKACGRGIYLDNCTTRTIGGYKFYLAFENGDCDSYITEKYFTNAIRSNVIPVVMGARVSYYRHISPPNSFIHVEEFKNPAELASYLHKLDKNDTLYNEYFAWKGAWTFYDQGNIWCRMCALLHAPPRTLETTVKKWRENERCNTRGPHRLD